MNCGRCAAIARWRSRQRRRSVACWCGRGRRSAIPDAGGCVRRHRRRHACRRARGRRLRRGRRRGRPLLRRGRGQGRLRRGRGRARLLRRLRSPWCGGGEIGRQRGGLPLWLDRGRWRYGGCGACVLARARPNARQPVVERRGGRSSVLRGKRRRRGHRCLRIRRAVHRRKLDVRRRSRWRQRLVRQRRARVLRGSSTRTTLHAFARARQNIVRRARRSRLGGRRW